MTGQPGDTKPTIYVVLTPSLYARVMTPEADAALHELGNVIRYDREDRMSSSDLAAQIKGVDALITGWGAPKITDEVLDNADRLRIIGHAAGSVKSFFPPEVWHRGITVTNAAATIAPAVAEYTLMAAIYLLRNVDQYREFFRSGDWKKPFRFPSEQLFRKRIGLVGAGLVGRELIRRLKGFECDIIVYDPYLGDDQATALGVRKVSLEELLRTSLVVSMHTASTPETHHMIGAEQLALLRDGAVFINIARSWLVDMDALYNELKTGRIRAAVDVYDKEPLPMEDQFRTLDNVLLTPHMAGESYESHNGLGPTVIEDLRLFFSGKTPKHTISVDQLATMA